MSRKVIIALVAIASLGLFAAPSAQAHGDETVTASIWLELPAPTRHVVAAQGTAASTYVHDRLTITVGLQMYRNGGWQTLAVGSKTVWNAKTVSKQARGWCEGPGTYRVYVAYTFVQNQVVSDSGTRYLAQQQVNCIL